NTTKNVNVEHNHAYAVLDYDPSSSLPFQVFNPWGINGGNDAVTGQYIWGEFVCNAAFLTQNFSYADRTVAAPSRPTAAVAALSDLGVSDRTVVAPSRPTAAVAALSDLGLTAQASLAAKYGDAYHGAAAAAADRLFGEAELVFAVW